MDKIYNYLEETMDLSQLPEMTVVIFGTAKGGKRLLRKVINMPCKQILFVDNDANKKGTVIKWNSQEFKIFQPDILTSIEKDELIIFIASGFYSEIKEQLIHMGFKNDRFFIDGLNILKPSISDNLDMNTQNLIRLQKVTNELLGKLHIERIKNLKCIANISEAEFKVSSQFGEDGIIQYIISKIPIENKIFVEFGVGNYTESNTRFLLQTNNWRGLVIDCSQKDIQYIKKDEIYWKHDLTAVHSFITRENINSIISNAKIQGDIGLLSIDIDGNDYWVWEAIDVISPRIVICEYNSVFGCDKAISIPYDANFNLMEAHYSSLYFGASLPALCDLADKKGYDFIGSESNGNNAFFVRSDISAFNKLSAQEGYVLSNFRLSKDKKQNLTFLSGDDRVKAISECKVYDIRDERIIKISQIL